MLNTASLQAIGMSAYRKGLALRSLVAEGHPQRAGRSDAELAEALLTQRPELSAWNKDTCRRYLQVAERMAIPEVQRLMMRWEFQFRRDCLVDGIMVLRAVVAAAASNEELMVLLNTLYWEQVCKMRTTVKSRGKQGGYETVHLMRAVLLRHVFYNYCRQAFPNHQAAIESFGSWQWYAHKYGMTEHGRIQGCTSRLDEEGDAEEEMEQQEEEVAPNTRFVSKTALVDLLTAVAGNKHEQAFVSLAKDQGNAATLDLSKDGMKTIQGKVQLIMQEYNRDFPPKPTTTEATPVTIPDSADAVSSGFKVRLTASIENEQEYEARLAEWNAVCAKAESDAVKTYIAARVAFVSAPYESDALLAALDRVPLLAESSRKLFKYDSLCMDPLNWKRLRQGKRSFWNAGKVNMTLVASGGTDETDTLAPLKNVYSTFRSTKDGNKLCEDVVVVVVPGPSGDNPENPPLSKAFASLKHLTPKHLGPKIGTITLEQLEILRQMNARGAMWRRKLENFLIFTYQNPPNSNVAGRKRMKYLSGGDTYYNNWPAPAVPTSTMAKCTEKQHEEIFRNQEPVDSGDEDGTMGADAQSLGDNVYPFPREHSHELTQDTSSITNSQGDIA